MIEADLWTQDMNILMEVARRMIATIITSCFVAMTAVAKNRARAAKGHH